MTGQTISHYKILEKIGEGGMGVVYKAEDTKLHRRVALKFLRPDAVESRELKARFLNEAEAAAALDHPNICTVHEIDEVDGQMFIAMACVEGESLAKRIRKRPLPLEEALNIAIQAAEGLHAAHKKGVIHRDIKPANLMIDPDGRVKVTDFGLAHLEQATKITKTGTVLGTPAYMSPEQVRGEKVDHRTDIWSLGVVLYEMATGQVPFKGEVEEAVSHSILYELPEPLTALRSGLPIELDRIVAKVLAKDPAERHQHADEMLVDLRALQKSVEGTAAAGAPAKSDSRKRLYVVAALVMLVLAIAAGIYITQRLAPDGPVSEPSIAVLPFANLSGDPENEYFSDGLAEEIINALTNVPGLRVAARTSAFAFRGREQDIREIGAKLTVDHVLEGSVRQSGNRIRVTAQLINASDGYQLWSERYERKMAMADVFAIQDEISQAIVDNLRVQFASGRPPTRRHTENLEAYNLYLKGRFHWNKRTGDGIARSKEYFEQAIALEPAYAPAYAGLGSYYWMLGVFGFLPPSEAMPKAKAELTKALELDDSLADAHAVMGCIRGTYEYDWQRADRDYARAMEPGTASSFVVERYAVFYLRPRRRFQEAEEAIRRALTTDPLSVSANGFLGLILMDQKKYAQAIEQFQTTIDMEPNFYVAHFQLAAVYVLTGHFDEAISAAERAVEISGRTPGTVKFLGWAYAMAGRKAEARELLDELVKASEETYVSALCFATIHMALGERDQAFERLEESIEQRNPPTVFVNTEPMFDSLRSDSRWAGLMHKMNLEP